YVLVFVAEIFRYRERQIGRLPAHQGRLVGGRHHHHRPCEAVLAEVVLQKFLHLPAALADKADHADVGIDIARQHRQQDRLADAGTGEDAEPLAAAAGQEGIERADAEIKRETDALARMRRRRRVAERHRRAALRQRPLAVDRLAHRVEDPAEPGRRRPHLARGVGNDSTTAAPHSFEACERHYYRIISGEADHLRRNRTAAAGLDHDASADRHRMDRSCDLHHQAAHADHPAIYIDAVDIADLLGKRLHCENLKFRRISRPRLTWCLPASLIIASLSLVTEIALDCSERTPNRGSRLGPPLNVELESVRIRKAALTQYL